METYKVAYIDNNGMIKVCYVECLYIGAAIIHFEAKNKGRYKRVIGVWGDVFRLAMVVNETQVPLKEGVRNEE